MSTSQFYPTVTILHRLFFYFLLGIGLGKIFLCTSFVLLILLFLYSLIFIISRKIIVLYCVVFSLGMWRISFQMESSPPCLIDQNMHVQMRAMIVQPPYPCEWFNQNNLEVGYRNSVSHRNTWIISPISIQSQKDKKIIWPDPKQSNRKLLIRVITEKSLPTFMYGDVIQMWGELLPMEGSLNPGEGNLQEYWHSQDIGYFFKVSHPKNIYLESAGKGFFLFGYIHYFRFRCIELLRNATNKNVGNILSALLLGSRTLVEDSILEDFRRTGVYHLLAISGLHVSLVLCFIHIVLVWLQISIFLRWFFMIIFAMMYAIFVGFETPVVRTMLMVFIHFSAFYLGYTNRTVHTLGVAGCLIVFLDPREFFQASFQFTFLAVLAIIRGYLPLATDWKNYAYQHRYDPWYSYLSAYIFFYIRELTIVSFVTWLFTLPILLYHFGYMNVFAPLLSIFAIPIVTLLLVGAILLLFSIVGIGWGACILGKILVACTEILVVVVQVVSQWQWAIYYWPLPFLVAVIVFYFLLFILDLQCWKKHSIMVCLVFIVICSGYFRKFGQSDCEIAVLHVGHGCCIYIRLPDGQNILYDCGSQTYNITGRVIVPFLQSKGITEISAVILSHHDSDHTNGLETLATVYPVRSIYVNRVLLEKGWHWLARFQQVGIPVIETYDQQTFPVNKNASKCYMASLSFLYPANKFELHGICQDNEHSLLVYLSIMGKSFLLTGDIGEQSCQELIRFLQNHPSMLPIHVLQVPHHGGILKNTRALLQTTQPQLAFINASRKFSHPHTIQQYQRKNRILYQTSKHGALQWTWQNGKESFHIYKRQF